MNLHSYYAAAKGKTRTCLIGTGGFGRSFLFQARKVPLLESRIAVDSDAETAAEGLRAAGVPAAAIRLCRTKADAANAWAAGDAVAAGDLEVVLDLPFEVLIEATGRPEPGARHALLAIETGRHVVLVSKEVDSVVGPGLARLARQRGVVTTPVDGDQPSLLIGLVTWAEVLGLEILAAGKSSEYDFVFDPVTGMVSSNGKSSHAPGLAAHWIADADLPAISAERSKLLAAYPQHAVPDLCELAVVANAVGLAPDRPQLHAPVARVREVAALFASRADGGLLCGERRIDVFHQLRTADEASFAGGVFVVVRCRDAASWRLLAEKGHALSQSEQTAMVYLPRHLLGLEAATSVLDAAVHGASGYGTDHRPRFDLIAVAEQPLAAGTRLVMGGHHHTIPGTRPELVPAQKLAPDAPAPFYLAADRVLVRDVAAGEPIRLADLDIDAGSLLLSLRRQQDAMDWAAPSAGCGAVKAAG